MTKIEFRPDFLKKLELLSVASKRIFAGKMKGERRSPRRGASVEFADYREYSQGDDYRHIDWNAFARFGDLFLKLFIEEEDLTIYLLLDCSKSMDHGDPGKFEFAARIAAALGYVCLANLDRVSVCGFSAAGLRRSRMFHNRNRVFELLDFLHTLSPEGGTALNASVDEFLGTSKKKGVAILISDLLSEDGFETALNHLKYSGYDPVVLQVFSPDEVDPAVGGDWTLVDSETGGKVDISLGARAAKTYKARLRAYTEALDEFCRARNIAVARAVTNQDFEDLVLKYFRQAALLR